MKTKILVVSKILIVLVFLFTLISLYSGAGFDLELNEEVPIYASWENVPFSEMQLLTQLKPKDHVLSIGCFDDKSEIIFQVALPDGRRGYMYGPGFRSNKRLIPSFIDLQYFLEDPIANLECLITVPGYSV